VSDSILHTLIDVAAGRRNLPPHDADALHEELTPGFTDQPLTEEEQARLDELQARKDRVAADQAAREAPAAAQADEAPAGDSPEVADLKAQVAALQAAAVPPGPLGAAGPDGF
jgi:hypothetical protein